MEDRAFTEVDLRLMLERATGFRADVIHGRFCRRNPVSRSSIGGSCRTGRSGASFSGRHGVPGRAMKQRYLEITFRKGKPFAAYLYLPRAAGAKAARTLDGGHGIRIDLDERGVPIGLEITAPSAVTISELNGDEEWAPLAA
jgi:uncharacterized protein YuzE